MPLLARLYVRTALAYLALALLLGVGLAAGPGAGLPGWVAALGPAWVHLLVVGWLTQLIFGVAYWLFPRHSRERPYGRTAPAWAAFFLLNAGLLLRAVAEPAVASGAGPGWRAALLASAAAQAGGALAFVVYVWPRVRAR
jgi:hypothetical protein